MYAWRLTLTMIDSRCHCSSMCRDLLVQPPAPVREHIRFHDAIPGQPSPLEPPAGLAARLGIFDATMVVMGDIPRSGIFTNTFAVCNPAPPPAMILGAWVAGGLLALVGAFIY